MRKLGKPRSPRNVSPDGQPRQSMQQAEKAFLVALRSAADAAECARSAFDALEKRKLRSVLYEEQGYLCVYCERRIAEGQQPCPRIDHWRPLSKNPNLALHWRNLYLNHPTLIAARAAAVESECDRLEDDYKGKTASKDDRAARAAAMLAERTLQEFVSIRVGWLTKTLSKGR